MGPIVASISSDILFRDDFFNLGAVTGANGVWTATNDGASGTVALASTHGGWVDIPTAAADNDYQLLSTNIKIIKPAAGRRIQFEARFKLTEANTDDANFVLGLSSVIASGFLQANGAGPASSYDGFVIYKVDGGTSLLFGSSNGSTQPTAITLGTFVSGQTYTVGFLFDPQDGTTAKITPYVDGNFATSSHSVAISGLDEMYVIIGSKAGGANAETLTVDYVQAIATRV